MLLARTSAGFAKRATFAKRCDSDPKTMLRIERGEHLPSLGVLTAVSRVAGVRLEWLATGEGEMRPAAA